MAVVGTSLYLIGGHDSYYGTTQSTVYLFDTTTTTWTSGLAMVRMRYCFIDKLLYATTRTNANHLRPLLGRRWGILAADCEVRAS
jgi:hypothetical protein